MTRSSMTIALVSVCVIACALPSRARAQAGIVQGIVGMTNTTTTQPFVAGSLGGKIGWFEVNGEFGKMQDILPPSVHDQIVAVAGPNVVAKVPAVYGLVNLRIAPTSGVIRPFVSAGMGAVQLRPQLSANAAPVAEALYPTDTRTKAALALGAGLEIGISRVLVIDGAYRYFRIYSDYHLNADFSNDTVMTNVNCLYASLGIRF
jgi:opacity protein-like surface antigen